jgi:hydroxyacylglutathione hydrolase
MTCHIQSITLPLPYRLGDVNCYLLKTETGYVLIDTACSNQRAELDDTLARAGCQPGNLKLIVLTHGDFDHAGNAAYLREKYASKIAMHAADAGMVERGDMFWNRTKGNRVIRTLAPILFRFGRSERFKPDLLIDDGTDLSAYGLAARVLGIPGHSRGSIGILTDTASLFCGDLLTNTDRPTLNSIMDDASAARASVDKLMSLKIDTIYPGHGKPFSHL